MKYIVRKPMPGAKVGDILKPETYEDIPCLTQEVPVTCLLIGEHNIQDAIDQGFIEPYEEKPKRWMAENGKPFFTTNIASGTFTSLQKYTYHDIPSSDIEFYKSGNYFKSKETAGAAAEALKQLLKYLHDEEAGGQTYSDMDTAISEARRLVLEDDRSAE